MNGLYVELIVTTSASRKIPIAITGSTMRVTAVSAKRFCTYGTTGSESTSAAAQNTGRYKSHQQQHDKPDIFHTLPAILSFAQGQRYRP